ncbi:MAG: putative acyltransferase [Ilumatobacteraceae bacterium]|nr:putative acyltransferase [Ilumatobacteraceae bacterium]
MTLSSISSSTSSRPTRARQRTQISRVPYLPGLDGLRALAVVAVMVYHANHEWLGGGFLGVEVFFVISGYLITLLLIAEHERNGFVDLGQFWLRRARRLLPALFVALTLLAIYMAFFERQPMGRTRGDFVAGLLYVSNWYQIFVGQGYTAAGAFAPLRHLWSLAVEEQFYLIWPLIMVAVLRRGRRHLPKVGMWLVGVSVAIALLVAVLYAGGDVATSCSSSNMNGYWRLFGRCISVNDALYLSTITRAGGLMLGAAFAMVWRPVAIMRGPLRDKGRQLDLLAIAGVAGLALLMWKLTLSGSGTNLGIRFDPWLFRGGFLWTGLATLLIVAAVTHQGAYAGKVFGNRLLNWVGTRSYGLYLYHWPIYQIIRKYAGVGLTGGQFVLAMAFTLPITELSYRFVETPIRKGKLLQWWRSRDRTHGRGGHAAEPLHPLDSRRPAYALGVVVLALVGFSVVSIGTATNTCVGDVECTLVQAGSPGSAAATPSSSSTPETTVPGAQRTDPAGAGVPVTVAETTTTAPAPPPELSAFGESVMLGAKSALEEGGFRVDARESRQASDMIAEITARRDANQIGPTVVVQVGTNGVVTDDEFKQIVELMPNSTIYFLTVKADVPWIDKNNGKIFGLPAKFPNVKVIDWNGRSAEVADDLSTSDGGAHLKTTKAMQFYANMIFDNIGKSQLDKPLA